MKEKVDREFQDYLDDLCSSCKHTFKDCSEVPGIVTVSRGSIVINCNRYLCVTMPDESVKLYRLKK